MTGATAGPPRTTTRHRPSLCFGCGQVLDASRGPSHPNPGDIALCLQCGHAHVFTDGLVLREPNPEEAAEIAKDPRIAHIQRHRKATRPATQAESTTRNERRH